MQDIDEHMQLSQVERQSHLALDEDCVERGGKSFYFRGLLAYYLDTTLPSGKRVHLCHACHNPRCSNPRHLYWGTPKENCQDRIDYHGGEMNVWERMVAKYGLEQARLMQAKKTSKRDSRWRGERRPSGVVANIGGSQPSAESSILSWAIDK